MLKVQRQNIILEYLETHEYARIEDLVSIIDASEITIRRDINELDEAGKLKKVHGGAQKVSLVYADTDVETRNLENIEAKQVIAKKALGLIKDGMTVYLDAGSSVGQLIPLLKDKQIEVYTHGFHHIPQLIKTGVACHLIGGLVKPSTFACVGVECIQSIRQYQFDLGFIGTNALDVTFGFSTPDTNEAAIKRTIIEQSMKAYCLVDDSKFNKISKVSFANERTLCIITNHKPSKAFEQYQIL